MAIASIGHVAKVLERQMGLRQINVRRQTRWRPTWFVSAMRDGESIDLVVRGERVDTQIFPLRHEVKFHRLLEEHGIPVPKIHGWLDELDAVVLDKVPGRPDFSGVPDTERDAVVDQYLQTMVRIHQLPIKPFADAGIFRGATPAESSVAGHWHCERLFRTKKKWPDPFMEFCLGWVHRNPPQSQGRETPIIWDTGQFHHQNGRMLAVLDLEFGHIGDPMLDLAVWRMRDTLIPFGDFSNLYSRYEELSGTAVDLPAIKRHHFAATINNQLFFGPTVAEPAPDTDLMNNMQWNSETNLHATEALAEYLQIELPTVETPVPRKKRTSAAFGHLVQRLKNLRSGDELFDYEMLLAFRMARHLQRADEIGDAIVEADLDDLHELLGHRPDNWHEGDEQLERFVRADADLGKHDERLLRLFHRRNLRVHLQLGPEGSKMVRHFRTQRFDGARNAPV
jgi:aminoglycoside phosphotransferase (APT) family kinase protein